MQNYFNDNQEVLTITERLIKEDILANHSMLVCNPAFFNLMSCDPYEICNNLFEYVPQCGSFVFDDEQDAWVNSNGEEYEPKAKEPLEWWQVSKYLYSLLDAIEEPVFEADWGYYWGRTCSGQAVELDGTIQECARLINKRSGVAA